MRATEHINRYIFIGLSDYAKAGAARNRLRWNKVPVFSQQKACQPECLTCLNYVNVCVVYNLNSKFEQVGELEVVRNEYKWAAKPRCHSNRKINKKYSN